MIAVVTNALALLDPRYRLETEPTLTAIRSRFNISTRQKLDPRWVTTVPDNVVRHCLRNEHDADGGQVDCFKSRHLVSIYSDWILGSSTHMLTVPLLAPDLIEPAKLCACFAST